MAPVCVLPGPARSPRRSTALAVIVAWFTAVGAAVPAPKDELLRLVPADVGFVAALQDLRGEWGRIQASPFARRFLQTAAGREFLASTDWAKLADQEKSLVQDVGLTWPRLRDDVLGDAVVFVYRPEGDEGLVLAWARDPTAATLMFERLDATQFKSGKLLEVNTRQHSGRPYKHRRRKDEPNEFQFQHGRLIAFGSGESLLKHVIDGLDKPASLPSSVASQFRTLGVDSATLVWWVNPRAFDKAINEKVRTAIGPAAAIVAALALHWRALDGFAAFIDVNADVRGGVAIAARVDALPAPTRAFLREAAQPSTLAEVFPADALVTLTGRLPLPAALQLVPVFLPDEAQSQLRDVTRKTLGAMVSPEVLDAIPTRLGPDWGLCVSVPVEGRLPAIAAAVRLTDPPGEPPAAGRIFDAVHSLFTIAAIGYNSHAQAPLTARSERQGEIEVRYFDTASAAQTGFRPAYAWKGGYLVIATAPEVIRRFAPPTEPKGAPASGAPASLLKVALRGWAAYLREQRDAAAGYLAAELKIDSVEARRRLATIGELLELLDTAEMSLHTAAGRATITLHVQPAAPLSP